jgi:polar amino acid transport system substrate-binding protein
MSCRLLTFKATFTLCLLLTTAALHSQPVSTAPVIFANSLIKPWGMEVNGSAQGLLIDVQYALSLETGLEHQVQLQPYGRVIHSIYAGDVDMAALFDARTDLSRVIKIAAIAESPVIIVGRSGMQPLTSIDELSGKLVGHMRGSKYGPIFDDATHFRKIPINTMQQALAMLIRGRIDAMTGVDLTFYWAIQQKRFSPTNFTPLLEISRPTVSLYMSKKSSRLELIPTYRAAMQKLHRSGVIDEIFGHNTQWQQMDGWSAPWSPSTRAPIQKASAP